MNRFDSEYRSKLTSSEDLVLGFKPGDSIILGVWFGQPHGVMQAICDHGKGVDPLFVNVTFATAAADFVLYPNVHVKSGFLGPYERAAQKQLNNVSFTPIQYADAGKFVECDTPPDYFIQRVAPMDERGYFNFHLAGSYEYDAVRWLARNSPSTRIVFEVNARLPRVRGLEEFGNNEIHISDVDVIVEDDTPLIDFGDQPASSEAELAIAAHVRELVDDRSTLQLGIGSLPMAIGSLLVDRRGLGVHTEMFCEAHIDLIEAGSVTNAHKGLHDGISVATIALGGPRLWEWIADNPDIAILPVNQVNAIPVLARLERLVSVNSVLTVDLAGQASAHCIGARTYSGLGGAFEFAYGSQMTRGGKSIVCLPSTSTLPDGRTVSNIVARGEAGTRITIPEHCIDWVVTEYGGVRLKFLDLGQRARALTSIAHPEFRDELGEQTRRLGLEARALEKHPPPPDAFFVRGDRTE